MRKLLTAMLMWGCLGAAAQDQDLAFLYIFKFYNDSIYHPTATSSYPSPAIVKNDFANFDVSVLLTDKKAGKYILGYSKKNKPVVAYYFPGTSIKKALVIGGVHGSELSAVEVAENLIKQLSKGAKPFYSVIIIPTLFPDNAETAATCNHNRILQNAGRYSHAEAIDPNRQLPALGLPFYIDDAKDAYGREIENENKLLLQLIQAYAPQRIINLHAIKDYGKAGIYADPRTDCEGKALGFSSDSVLAVSMARYIDEKGGNVAGNKIKSAPTALYYLDPKPAPVGEKQERNLAGANMKGKINGVSLGSWAATAVCDETRNYFRPAMRILTIEFPGYKMASEYKYADDKKWYKGLVNLYATSIHQFFLQSYLVEEEAGQVEDLVSR